MAAARDRILERIRGALGRSGPVPAATADGLLARMAQHPAGPRPAADWQPLARFRERALAASSTVDEVETSSAVPEAVAGYLARNDLPRSVVVWPALAQLDWQRGGIEAQARKAVAADAIGITGCFCAIAETGTLLQLSAPDRPASTSLLAETHIAIVPATRIVIGMEEAWALVRSECANLPRAMNFISGPSRTADIEQTLVLGAHGPYRVHIVVVRGC
ncbi:MAG: lactate utilization protein C [Burkholderiales bacterium]|nr:lactate utilization protein C [Burkholderiales bacterium]